MAWNLNGELIESCSCNVLCPCWYGVKELMRMDQGWCDSAFVFRIQGGKSDGVDLGGTTVVVATDFPGPTLFDGKGTARLHIEESASQDQRRELEAIFQGKKGGPMEILAGLMSNWLPTNYCTIEIQDDGNELVAKVGSVGQVESSVLKNESGNAMTFENAGFASAFQFDNLRAKIAPSRTKWKDPQMPRSFETHSGARASWNWKVA